MVTWTNAVLQMWPCQLWLPALHVVPLLPQLWCNQLGPGSCLVPEDVFQGPEVPEVPEDVLLLSILLRRRWQLPLEKSWHSAGGSIIFRQLICL